MHIGSVRRLIPAAWTILIVLTVPAGAQQRAIALVQATQVGKT
jgi:hypothetical protein